MSEMTGLRFELDAQGYQALPIAHGQAHLCWEAPYQNTLLELAGEIFPRAVYAPEKEPCAVCFSYTDEGGEWMHTSHASNEEEPTLEEFRRVQACFEYLYSLTVDPQMPRSKRDFLRNLRLPDPRQAPELWRVVDGRLFVLWGLTKRGMDGSFSPYLASPEGGLCGLLGIAPESIQMPEQTPQAASLQPRAQANSPQAQDTERQLPWWKKFLHFLLGIALCVLGLILLLWLLQSCTAGKNYGPQTPPFQERPPVDNPKIPSPSEKTPGENNNQGDTASGGDLSQPPTDPKNPAEDPEEPEPSEETPGENNNQGGTASGGELSQPPTDPKNPAEDPEEPESSEETPGENNNPGGTASGGELSQPPTDPKNPAEDLEEPESSEETPREINGQGDTTTAGVPPQPPSEQHLYTFRVELVKEVPSPSGELSRATFRLVPREVLPEDQQAQVRNWSINGRSVPNTAALTFSPEGGLRYDRGYTLSAKVLLNGVEQRVEPYQWNLFDEPTWQIIEDGLERDQRKMRYRLVCCNASTVTPMVRSWQVKFRAASASAAELPFIFEKTTLGGNRVAISWDIGPYKGAYFLELTADVQYATLRGHTATLTHRELIPFVHASSVEELSCAKYDKVVENVYFCLASQTDGSFSNGTAFAISNRRLLTNYHVAVGSMPGKYVTPTEYTVRPVLELSNGSGRTYHARVVASDRARDLALLELCDAQGGETDVRLPGYLPLATSEALVGISPETPRHVFALGYPRGTVRMGPPAITEGKCERIERISEIETVVSFTDIKPGYSGGPLIDYASGVVLGVNHSALIDKEAGYKGANFATAATEVHHLPLVR